MRAIAKTVRQAIVYKLLLVPSEIETSRDRNATFEPELIKKRETVLADTLESKIIGLYGLGMSLRDISSHLKEMYDADISHTTLSNITDRIIPVIKEWQARPLEDVYCIVWLDAMHYKVKDEGRIIARAVYNILGINKEGQKDLLGMYISESEGANFWLRVLSDLRNRGVEDILIASIDNLKGLAETVAAPSPQSLPLRGLCRNYRFHQTMLSNWTTICIFRV